MHALLMSCAKEKFFAVYILFYLTLPYDVYINKCIGTSLIHKTQLPILCDAVEFQYNTVQYNSYYITAQQR